MRIRGELLKLGIRLCHHDRDGASPVPVWDRLPGEALRKGTKNAWGAPMRLRGNGLR
jgi:hypothetical protein